MNLPCLLGVAVCPNCAHEESVPVHWLPEDAGKEMTDVLEARFLSLADRLARCVACGYTGRVDTFTVRFQEPEEPP